MGLDMYLIGRKRLMGWNYEGKEDGFPLIAKELELGYWRKFHDLHRYVVENYGDDNGAVDIYLDEERLEELIVAIKNEAFIDFNEDRPEDKIIEQLKQESIEIIERALKWKRSDELYAFKSVYYRASW
jgi:hypothetical protein